MSANRQFLKRRTEIGLSKIYMSYSHKDGNISRRLAEDLKKMGHIVWVDVESLKASEDWESKIRQNISTWADLVLILLSPQSIASRFCVEEWDFALGHGIPIVPVLIQECIAPAVLADRHWIRFCGSEASEANYQDGLNQLLRVLEFSFDWA